VAVSLDGLTELTPEQKRLVRENIGLVGVHLKKGLGGKVHWHRAGHLDDLFQEGCLGLMRAAQAFDPARGIPFAAFALARIHAAVSRAIRTQFDVVYIPPPRSKAPAKQSEEGGLGGPAPSAPARPVVVSLSEEALGSLEARDTRRVLPFEDVRSRESAAAQAKGAPEVAGPEACGASGRPAAEDGTALDASDPSNVCGPAVDSVADSAAGTLPIEETVGERLYDKYNRALAHVGVELSKAAGVRGDRAVLVQALIEGRFRVPHEDQKTSLREIARATASSFARVAQCEKQIGAALRGVLRADPEFVQLRQWLREEEAGPDTWLDEQREQRLQDLAAEAMAARLEEADEPTQARMLHAVLTMSEMDLIPLLKARHAVLSPVQREELHRHLDQG
jgi:hypothetical protein